MEDFNNLGFIINGLRHLTGKQAYECYMQGAAMVDVREDFEIAIKSFGLDRIIFCPFGEFDQNADDIPRNIPVIIADCVGLNSKEAALKLLAKGYTQVANLSGGICDWERDGLPMKKNSESMSGQCPCMIKSKSNDQK